MAGNLGRALIEFWRSGVKASYTAKGWHAQISQITAVKAGADAANRAGLDVSKRTLLAWLADTQEPSERNKSLIRDAYRYLSGHWDPSFETRQYRIYGEIDSGDRIETRTLLIEGQRGQWAQIRAEMEKDDPDPVKIEDLFIEDVIVEDIGQTSPEWDFPGQEYSV